MGVLALSEFSVAPGGLYQAQHLLRDGVKIFQDLGVETRLATLVRGGAPNTLALVMAYPDLAAYGAGMERGFTDDGMSVFMRRAQDVDALQPLRAWDWQDVPGTGPDEAADTGSHRVLMARVVRIHDGQTDEAMARCRSWQQFMAGIGAPARVLSSMHSDPGGLHALAAWFQDFDTWGQAMADLHADTGWLAFQAGTRSANASWQELHSSLYRML